MLFVPSEGRDDMGSGKERRPGRTALTVLATAVAAAVAVSAVGALGASAKQGTGGTAARPAASIKVGLITKDVTNPFFVKMRAGATAQAKKLGATLMYA